MRAVIVGLLLSAVAISADLQLDIQDVLSHLPMKEIESIGKQYVATYPNYADELRFMEKINYADLVKDFLQTDEGQKFIEYFNQRNIDIERIIPHITQMVMDINRKWLEPIKEDDFTVGLPISGNMIGDYKKAIAASDFGQAVSDKIEVSPEFANLVAAIKDPQYHALFYDAIFSKGLNGIGKNPKMRGFWKQFWPEIVGVVAVGAFLLG